MEILSDRFMGGGGYTSDDILSITAIYPEQQRGYKYDPNENRKTKNHRNSN